MTAVEAVETARALLGLAAQILAIVRALATEADEAARVKIRAEAKRLLDEARRRLNGLDAREAEEDRRIAAAARKAARP